MTEATLRDTILRIGEEANASAIAVAAYDFEHHTTWSLNPSRWFHAASTIKVPVLLAVYEAIEQHRLAPFSRVHVRNRFYSMVDGKPFRVGPERDANAAVHAALGRMLTVHELAAHMIVTSSNLATNLLLDLVGLDTVQRALDDMSIDGIDIRRGVEDERAFEVGINNRVTADGLVQLLRLVAEERAFSPELSREMLEILHAQEFRNGIPARLPSAVRVAHKTGEISTIAHDAGVVYPPHRKPYVIAVLTEWEPEAAGR